MEMPIANRAVQCRRTVDFLDKLMQRYELKTDYQLHKLLAVSKTTIYRYRAQSGGFDDALCVRVAELLDLPADYVLSCIAAERAQAGPAKKLWEELAKKLGTTVTTALLALAVWIGGPGGPGTSSAAPIEHNRFVALDQTIHMRQRRRRQEGVAGWWKRAWRALVAWCQVLVLTLALAGCAAPGSPSSAIADFCLVSLDGRCLEVEHRLVLPSSPAARPCP